LLKEELEARVIKSKSWTTASGRLKGGKSFSRGALYLMLQNRLYRGEIVHKGQSHSGEHTPIIDQALWDGVQAELASNAAARNSRTRTRQPSPLAGMLFDGDGHRMTPTHAVKNGVRYRYYVSRPLIINGQSEESAGLRIPAGQIEQLVTSRVRQWLVDPGSIYQATRLSDPSMQHRLIARAAEIGKTWPELPATRQRAFLTALIERIHIGANQIDIHFRLTRLGAILDVAAPSLSATDDEAQILSIPVQPRRSGREIRMLIDGTDPFATAKPDARLVKLVIRARRFNAALLDSDEVPFAALAKREGVSPSYFTRLVRLSYLAPDITQAILDGRQPRRSGRRQAAGAFASATGLERATDSARPCLITHRSSTDANPI
jgi:site-specific DNA recombinase